VPGTLITDADNEKAKELIWQYTRVISALLAIFLLLYMLVKFIWRLVGRY
jgi:hypothetical protein